MKVCIVSASPRVGGNSDVLCDQFIKGAQQAGHEVKKIQLAKEKIHPCVACYACRKTKACFQKDGMDELLETMIESDVIVLATPVYFYSMDSQMKMFIDRCLPRYLEIKDKRFYFIATAADPEHGAADETLAGLRGFLRCLPGAKEEGVMYGTGTWDKGDVYQHPSYQEAYQLGSQI